MFHDVPVSKTIITDTHGSSFQCQYEQSGGKWCIFSLLLSQEPSKWENP